MQPRFIILSMSLIMAKKKSPIIPPDPPLGVNDLDYLDFEADDFVGDSTFTRDICSDTRYEAAIELANPLAEVFEDPGDNQIVNIDASLLSTTLVDCQTAPQGERRVSQDIHNSEVLVRAPENPKSLDIPQNITDAFIRAFFWPMAPEKGEKKRRQKQKIPTVVTSREWQVYYAAKALEKIKKRNYIEERKRNRELAGVNKKREADEKKKLEAAEEKKRNIEIEKEKKR